MNLLAIEIGGTKLQAVLGDETGAVYERRKVAVSRAAGAEGIRDHLRTFLPELARCGKVDGIGVGFGGPVDWRSGRICVSHQIEGWSGFDLAGWIRSIVDAPVVVENDANTAALGEALAGAGRGYKSVFYTTLGSGVGGGMVIDGRVYHGALPGEVEFGHIRLDRHGTTVESRCSGWAVDERVRKLARSQGKGSKLVERALADPGGEARHLSAALAAGDPLAAAVLQELAEDLAFALSHVVHLLHPHLIIIGGGLSNLGESLRERVEQELPKSVMDAFLPPPPVVLSALGETVVPIGALYLATLAVG